MSSDQVKAVAEFYHAENKETILNWIDSPHIQYQRGERHVLELRIIFVSTQDEDVFEELIDKLTETPGTVRHLQAPNIKCSRCLVRKIARMLAVNKTLACVSIAFNKDDMTAHLALARALIKNTTLEEIQFNHDEEYTNKNIVTLFYNVISRRTRPDVYKLFLGNRELFTERLDLLHSRALPGIFAKTTTDTIEMNMSNFVVIDKRSGEVIAQQIANNTHRGFIIRGGKITFAALSYIAQAMSATKSVAILRLNISPSITAEQHAQIATIFERAFLKNPFLPRGSRWYLFDDQTNYFAQLLRNCHGDTTIAPKRLFEKSTRSFRTGKNNRGYIGSSPSIHLQRKLKFTCQDLSFGRKDDFGVTASQLHMTYQTMNTI